MSFDFNILNDLLFTVPFLVGYTRPSYRDATAQRQAVMRAHMYQEKVEEQREWEKYQKEVRAEEKKGIFATFAGAIVSSAIGFMWGGVGGAKIGWNSGKALGRNLRKQDKHYFDATAWLEGNKILKGGKFNRTLDRVDWRNAINDSEDRDSMSQLADLMDIGKGAFVGVTNDWSNFNVKDWRDLTRSERFGSLVDSFKKEKLDDFMDARDERKRERLAKRTKEARASVGLSDIDEIDLELPEIEEIESPAYISEDYADFEVDIETEAEVERQIDEAIDNAVETVQEDPSTVIPQLTDHGWHPFDREWRQDRGKMDWANMWENLSQSRVTQTGKNILSIPVAVAKGIKDWAIDFGKFTIEELGEWNESRWKPFQREEGIGFFEEWRPFKTLVDNLRDIEWRPFDYDWRVEHNKNWFSDLIYPEAGKEGPPARVSKLSGKQFGERWRPFEDFHPLDQDWRRANDKFIFQDWWQNKRVRPFRNLAEKIGQYNPEAVLKLTEEITAGDITTLAALSVEAQDIKKELEIESPETPLTDTPAEFFDETIQIQDTVLEEFDAYTDPYTKNIINQPQNKSFIQKSLNYIETYGIENIKRYGGPIDLKNIYFKPFEDKDYIDFFDWVVEQYEAGKMDQLLGEIE